jgi:hypothetical protein
MIRRVFVEDQPKVRTHHTPFSIEDIQSAVQEGRQAERERIVALLEQADSACSPWAIALIRGQNK